jgi:hypothetical protein
LTNWVIDLEQLPNEELSLGLQYCFCRQLVPAAVPLDPEYFLAMFILTDTLRETYKTVGSKNIVRLLHPMQNWIKGPFSVHLIGLVTRPTGFKIISEESEMC